MTVEHTMHVLVIGCGPAGRLIAAACAEAGLATSMVGPIDADWVPNYAAWVDELAPFGPRIWADTWSEVRAVGDGWEHRIERPYGFIDGPAFRAALDARLTNAGGQKIDGTVVELTQDLDASTARLSDGRTITTRIVIDATGHGGTWVHAEPVQARAFQTAYGMWATIKGPTPAATFMDWRGAESSDGPPSFLYAFPLRDGRVFFEETVLTGPAVPIERLQVRLRRRLDRLGVSIEATHDEEHCVIPLDLPRPRSERVLAFGGAASMTHPATGYLVGYCASRAPEVARRLAGAIESSASPEAAVAAGSSAVADRSDRAVHRLLLFGGQILGKLDAERTQAFFAAFFGLSAAEIADFLSRQDAPPALRRTMWNLYRNSPPSIRAALTAAGFRRGISLLPALLAGGSVNEDRGTWKPQPEEDETNGSAVKAL